MGILKDKCIFATDAAFLNDSSELAFAGLAVQRHLEDQIANIGLSPPPPGSDELRRLHMMRETLDWLEEFNNADYNLAGKAWTVFDGATFVSCFTENPNQLSQWRGYGGRGYSAGFTRESLDKLVVKDGRNTPAGEAIEVGYGDAAISNLYTEVSEYFDARLHAPGGLGDTIDFLPPKMAAVKDGSFSEEKEWRVRVSRYLEAPRGIQFREGARLVPYLRLGFDLAAVAYVYIGPSADAHDVRALRYFLAANKYDLDNVWVEDSQVPYRPV
jgi:hypothetical protein